MKNIFSTIKSSFVITLISYLFNRLFSLIVSIVYGIFSMLARLKKFIVQNLFWGRTTMYKNFFQVFILGLTMIIGFTGVTNQFSLSKAEAKSLFLMQNEDLSLVDQTSSISNDTSQYDTSEEKYIVQAGDSVESVARKIVEKEKEIYGDSVDISAERIKRKIDTIKYTNSLFTANPILKVGQSLTVFIGIDGLIYKVAKGDTIKKIAEKYKINEFDLIDTNIRNLESNLGEDLLNLPLETGSSIFVPVNDLSKEIQAKTDELIKKNQKVVVKTSKPNVQFIPASSLSTPAGSDCGGVVWIRGFSNTHFAIDISKGGGCQMIAMDSGTVVQARWASASAGYQVQIDHGNGYVTQYSHLSQIYFDNASEGMKINKGTPIGHMGMTGRATGVHLHLAVYFNKQLIDPERVVERCKFIRTCL
ncbi:MAG: peptidoglycan DD-metalloendopeptidase family protein [bacterium]